MLKVACEQQTYFRSSLLSHRKVFSAGETRAEECVCSPQAMLKVACGKLFSRWMKLGLSTGCSATFWQLLVFRATCCVSSNFLHSEKILQLSSNYEISEQLLTLKLAFIPYCTTVQLTIFAFPVKKEPNPPRAHHGRKITVAGLLGQRFLEKIQNAGLRFTLD